MRRFSKLEDAPSSIRRSNSQKKMQETSSLDQEPWRYIPVVQCALYGAEMLSKDFVTCHAINILVVNKCRPFGKSNKR